MLPSFKEVLQMTNAFGLTVFAWIFFRAENLEHALQIISEIFSSSLFSLPTIGPLWLYILIACFMAIEWIGRRSQFALAELGFKWPRYGRWAFYYLLIILVFSFGGKPQEFIYFQF